MNESEKAQMRLACINEASRLKQNQNTSKELEGKSVIDVAEELLSFVMGS
jgi:hypothetical protein